MRNIQTRGHTGLTTTTRLLLAALLALTAACSGAQQRVNDTLDPTSDLPLPVDPRVRTGKLDNGLTYFILRHQKPEKRALLWLAVNAGSAQEDDDQRGLAHFLEHMAFNGTERFPKMAIVNFIERIGMRFGADLNAYTSFDETVYQLQVPTDQPGLVDKGLQILQQWASGVALEPEEIEKERGVVLEEWRKGLGAGKRVMDKQLPVLLHGSRYAQRLPIGLPKVIKGAPREALARYYKDWYRPDLMAVVVVGDVDVDAMQQRLVKTFGQLRAPDNPRSRPTPTVPAHGKTLVSTVTDKELERTTIQLVHKLPRRPLRSAVDYRAKTLERLYAMMLNARFAELRPSTSSGSPTRRTSRSSWSVTSTWRCSSRWSRATSAACQAAKRPRNRPRSDGRTSARSVSAPAR